MNYVIATVKKSQLGIGGEADAASIGIPASGISVRYRSIPVPDWGTLIPVPDSPSTAQRYGYCRCSLSNVCRVAHRVLRSSVGYSVAQ